MPQLTKELLQEKQSRTKLTERLHELGWIVDPVATDIGEDLIVRIMNGTRFSGITFFVQLKSRSRISPHERKQSHYSQKIDVEHLEHWEGSTVPVVLLVWDMSMGEGYWILALDAWHDLEKRAPKFRSQKYVQVPIPFANSTTDKSLNRLRRSLAFMALPSVRRGRKISMELEFKFPTTKHGQRQRKALSEVYTHGKAAHISGTSISKFVTQGWAARLFGDLEKPVSIKIEPVLSGHIPTVPLRFESISDMGAVDAVLPYVELRPIRIGTKEVVLSNEQQGLSALITITLTRPISAAFHIDYKLRPTRTTVNELYGALRFAQSIRLHRGLRIVQLRGDGNAVYRTKASPEPAPSIASIVEVLADIQKRIESFGVLTLKNGWRLSSIQRLEIYRIHKIITEGIYRSTGQLSFSWGRTEAKEILEQLLFSKHDRSQEFQIHRHSTNEKLRILGINIPISKVMRSYGCPVGIAIDTLRQLLRTGTPEYINITLQVTITERYPDFASTDPADTVPVP